MKEYSKYLDKVLSESFNDIEIDDVKVPFQYKDNAIYLGKNKIIEVVLGDKPVFKFLNKQVEDDSEFVIDYFYESIENGEIENEKIYYIDLPVRVVDIDVASDSDIDGSGYEYSFLYPDSFKVMWGGFEISNIIGNKENNKIAETIKEELNKDYKPKYYGSHRTY
jgi:hypothetical protein